MIHSTIIKLLAVMFSLITVMQDTEGRVERLALYNLPKRLSKAITITNPYMHMAKDSKPIIHVDNPTSILKKVSICHFCSKQAAKLLCCGKCCSAHYCSKQCQVSDWKELNHKAVCFAE